MISHKAASINLSIILLTPHLTCCPHPYGNNTLMLPAEHPPFIKVIHKDFLIILTIITITFSLHISHLYHPPEVIFLHTLPEVGASKIIGITDLTFLDPLAH